MSISQPRAIALIVGRLDRSRVTDAARDLLGLEFTDSRARVASILGSSPPVSILMLEPFDKTRAPSATLVARMREVRPELCIIGYLARGNAADFLEFARAGVHDIVFRGETAEAALRESITRGLRTVARGRVLTALEDSLSHDALALVGFCLEYVSTSTSHVDVAKRLGVDRKMLQKRCRLAGLPAPGALFTWTRLMSAAAMLDSPGRRVEDVAASLAFGSASALRNALKRHTGMSATELRRGGALATVIEAFMHPAAHGRRPPNHSNIVALVSV